MSLYLELARLVDAEQVDIKHHMPPLVKPLPAGQYGEAIGFVSDDASLHVVNDRDWIIRPLDAAGKIEVCPPDIFLARYCPWLENLDALH